MSDLFQAAGLEADVSRPLADRLRPRKLADIVGQDHLVGPNGSLSRMLASGGIGSLILWGPPGTGKTTAARLLAGETKLEFEQLSAIFSGVADLKKAFERARERRRMGKGTLLFVDEIHRFNRAQQDSFLPVMEDGTIALVGATTENPSFELNAALLSRAQVLVFRRLDAEAIETLLQRAEAAMDRKLPLTAEARETLVGMADGDGRAALTLTEDLFRAAREGETFDVAGLVEVVQRRAPVYDKGQDGHYNLISALHKAVRGSDPDAALYYLARMFVAGEDPLYIARRVVRMAVEDIGLADPEALVQANAAKEAYDFLGSPEGELAISQAVDLLRHRAEIERRLRRLQEGDPCRKGARLAAAAQAHPERADEAHAPGRLFRGLRVRPRRPRRLLGPGLLPRGDGARDLLRSAGPRLRARDPQAARLLVEEAGRPEGIAAMKVRRIVANVGTPDVAAAQRFYGDVLGLDVLMDLGWIATYGSDETARAQVSFMSEGGSGTEVPDLSIEVDDLDEALRRVREAAIAVEYGPAEEPWGVRRFYVRDPFGRLVNIVAHAAVGGD